MPLMDVGDRAALSTERLLEQQDGKQEDSLGAADGSQLRNPNARHGKNNLHFSILCPLGLSMDRLLQQEDILIVIPNPKINLNKNQFICRLRKFWIPGSGQ